MKGQNRSKESTPADALGQSMRYEGRGNQMTTIDSQEDFQGAQKESPRWKEAARTLILGEEVLQLPAQFNAFMERTEAFTTDQTEFKDCPDRPVVASVRSGDEVDEDVKSGVLGWCQITQQQMAR